MADEDSFVKENSPSVVKYVSLRAAAKKWLKETLLSNIKLAALKRY